MIKWNKYLGNLYSFYDFVKLEITWLRPNLLLGDVQDAFQGELFKVKAVTLVKIGADRLGVVVDHHRPLAHLSQSSDTGHRAPVKLNTAAWWIGQLMDLSMLTMNKNST